MDEVHRREGRLNISMAGNTCDVWSTTSPEQTGKKNFDKCDVGKTRAMFRGSVTCSCISLMLNTQPNTKIRKKKFTMS